MPQFELQPPKEDLQNLAQQFWEEAGDKWREAENIAFGAGAAIRAGDYNLENLEKIVRWKSERVVHHLRKNNEAKIRTALSLAASPGTTIRAALEALCELDGVAIPVASAILTTIFPERYTVLDFRALEALGHQRQDTDFYERYLTFCRQLADEAIIAPQEDLPAPTALRALDRALWQWSKNNSSEPKI